VVVGVAGACGQKEKEKGKNNNKKLPFFWGYLYWVQWV
jgi:hypothetical protein